jgi:hypothetical protein
MNPSRFFMMGAACGTLSVSAMAQGPSDIPGLQLWLDAQDAVTISTSAGTVLQWDSKAGGGVAAMQPLADMRPTLNPAGINGLPSIRFDTVGTPDGMAIQNAADNFGINGLYDIFVVDQYWGASAGRTLQSRDVNWLLGKWGGPAVGEPTGYNSFFAGAFFPAGAGTTGTPNVPAVSEGLWAATEFALLHGGKGYGYQGGGYAPGRLGISASGAFPAESSQSDMGEIIAYNRVLTDTERRGVVNYLSAKWNMPRQFQRHFATQSTVFTGGDAGEGLDFTGNFVAAAVMGIGAPTGQTIGNANFAGDTSINLVAEYNFLNWANPNYGATANDNALEDVMRNIRWSAADAVNADSVSGSVGGLVIGRIYKAQFLFSESGYEQRATTVNINGKDEYKNFAIGAVMTPNAAPTSGVALVHQFIATSTTMTFELKPPSRTGDRNPTLSAFTLEDRGVNGVASKGTISAVNPGVGHGLDLTGDFVVALDMGGGVTGTIGDAHFVPGDTYAGATIWAEYTLFYNRPELGGSPTDDMLEDILFSIRWDQTSGIYSSADAYNGFDFGRDDGVSVEVPGLTLGYQYKLQLLFSDSNSLFRGFDIVVNDVLAERNFSVGALTVGDNSLGAFWAYEFTADQTELNILLSGYTAAGFSDRNPILSGMTLELVVPEPGGAALLLLGGAALGFRRNRGTTRNAGRRGK